MSISKRALADGTIVYDVREMTGIKRDGRPDRTSVTCRTMAEAKVEQAKLIAMRDGMRNRSGRCSFRQYVDEVWWPSLSSLAPSSRSTYERELRLRLLPAFGAMDIRDIDRTAIQRMVSGCGTADVARKAVGVLKTILNEAMGDGLILSNPARARYSMPAPGRKRDNGVVVTTFADMAPLLGAVDAFGDPAVSFLASTGLLMGLRPEERYGLDWEDVDMDQRTAHIRRAYTQASKAEGGLHEKAPKTEKSDRVLAIPAGVLSRLPEAGSGPVATGRDGGRLSPSTAKHRWTRFLRWCETEGRRVPPVTLENMRHSFATSYLHAGGLVADLSAILGHADINTTYRRYVRPSVEDMRRGMGVVPSL